MEIRPILSALMRSKTGPLLVAVQVALSLAILANALHLVTLRIQASERPSGVADESSVGYVQNRPIAKLTHEEAVAQERVEYDIIRAVPGVKSVAWTSQMPMSRSGSSGSVRASLSQTQESAEPALYFVAPGFVSTLGLRIVEGRDLTDADVVEADPDKDSWEDTFPKAAIVTRALAQRLFPQEDHFAGRNFYLGMGKGPEVRIVGVVDRLQTTQAQGSEAGEFSTLLPYRVTSMHSRWAIRTEAGRREKVMADVAEALRLKSPNTLRISKRSVTEDRYNRYRNEKAFAWMLIAVAALLLLVTLSGIVGMTSLRVAQRRKQIGIRRALGARWRDIMRYFITENLLVTGGGIVAGLLLALGLNAMLVQHLHVARLPAGDLAIGAAVLLALGLAAVCGPASRAARIPPAIATRTA